MAQTRQWRSDIAKGVGSAGAAQRTPAARGSRLHAARGRPGKIICLGVNYREHLQEAFHGDRVETSPTIFMRCPSSLLSHGRPIILPKVSATLDYEAEMVVVVGKRAKHLDVSNALSCIAGYSCANDGSIREFQVKTTQWDMGKNFDATGAFGPWMVTADDLPPGGKGLKIECRLNGMVMQSDNTANMIFPVAESIAYVTQGMTLEPGDIIMTGTPSGVGLARKPPVWMKAGDICEIEIEGIGVLSNAIADESNSNRGLLQIEWVIFVILRAIPVYDGDAIADW
jgi:acylpyruvate hydrolase